MAARGCGKLSRLKKGAAGTDLITMERRKEVRFGTNEPVVLSVSGSALKKVPGKLGGVSKSGLRVFVNVPIKVGTSVQVKWDSGTLVGEARYCHQILPERYSVGLRIISVMQRSKLRSQPQELRFD